MENIMGTEKISKLVLKTGLPLMFSLLISSMYNFVDSIFVSHVSENALTAVSLSSPVQVLVSAFGCGIAVGLNAAVSKALGQKNQTKVKNATSASFCLGILAWIIIAVLAILFIKPYFIWQSGGNQEIAEYGIAYLSVCMLFSFGQMGQWIFDRLVIASGKSNLFIFTLSAASLTNLILDPIFIFGYFGIPAMGTLGAAIATVIGQCVGCIAGYIINKKYNKEIPIEFTLHPDLKSMIQILKVGIPTAIVQSISSFVGIFMNSILISFSTTAIAVYGICTKIQNLVLVGVHGIDNGVIPIVAYNYGANKPARIKETRKWATIFSLAIYGIFFIVLEIFTKNILVIFDASQDMMNMGVAALRIMSISFYLSHICLVIAAMLQGLSLGTKSMYLTMMRQVIFPFGLVFIFQFFQNINLIWLAFILAELFTIPIGIYMYNSTMKKMF
ncbi:MAG: MATE family efflux transporter [Thomasclavelia sp.]